MIVSPDRTTNNLDYKLLPVHYVSFMYSGKCLTYIVKIVLTSVEGDMYDRYHTEHSDSDERSIVTFPISSKGLK